MSCNQVKMRWWWLPWCTCCVQGGLPCAAALRPWNRSCDPSPAWGIPCSLPMTRMEASTMDQTKHDLLVHTRADVLVTLNAASETSFGESDPQRLKEGIHHVSDEERCSGPHACRRTRAPQRLACRQH